MVDGNGVLSLVPSVRLDVSRSVCEAFLSKLRSVGFVSTIEISSTSESLSSPIGSKVSLELPLCPGDRCRIPRMPLARNRPSTSCPSVLIVSLGLSSTD